MNCDQCEALMINGMFCHETGCTNTHSRYNEESGEWIKQRECFDCGCTVDADDPCCSVPFEEDDDDSPVWWSESLGRIELQMTLDQARSASHSGQCDADVLALSRVPGIAQQLAKIEPDTLRRALKEYGAWDASELADHDQNLQRVLWIAACDIREDEG